MIMFKRCLCGLILVLTPALCVGYDVSNNPKVNSVDSRADALFGEWLFNDTSGAVATETSGHANNATLVGGTPGWGADYYFKFNALDGDPEKFMVSKSHPDFNINMQKSFRLEMSIRTTTGLGALFVRQNISEDWQPGCKAFFLDAEGKLQFDCGWVDILRGTKSVIDGKWHDLVLEFNAGSGIVSMYIDGTLDVASSPGAFNDMTHLSDDWDIMIGIHGNDKPYTGDMKSVRCFEIQYYFWFLASY